MNNDILVVEWKGKAAHFKDLSTNSNSLCFHVPPRPTIIGALGYAMGLLEDEYPNIFSTENCNIAIEPMSENIKSIDVINYINSKISNASANVSVQNLYEKNNEYVRYWLYIRHKNKKILDELEHIVKNSMYKIGRPGMGKMKFPSTFDFITRTEIKEMSKVGNVIINSICPEKYIEDIDFERDYREKRRLTRSLLHRELTVDRELKSVEDYVIPLNMKGICVAEVNKEYNVLDVNGEEKRIYWM